MKIARRTCESSTGDCTLERDLAGGEYHLVIRVITVPAGDLFFGGLANVLTVADAAGEYARDVQPIGKSGIGAEEGKARFAMNFTLHARGFSCILVKTEFELRDLTTHHGKQLH